MSGSKATSALETTRSPFSEINCQPNAVCPRISLAARSGSIIDVRQAIGNPGKIKKPIWDIF